MPNEVDREGGGRLLGRGEQLFSGLYWEGLKQWGVGCGGGGLLLGTMLAVPGTPICCIY